MHGSISMTSTKVRRNQTASYLALPSHTIWSTTLVLKPSNWPHLHCHCVKTHVKTWKNTQSRLSIGQYWTINYFWLFIHKNNTVCFEEKITWLVQLKLWFKESRRKRIKHVHVTEQSDAYQGIYILKIILKAVTGTHDVFSTLASYPYSVFFRENHLTIYWWLKIVTSSLSN